MTTTSLRASLATLAAFVLTTGCPALEPPGETDDAGSDSSSGSATDSVETNDAPTSSVGMTSGHSSGPGSGDSAADSSGDPTAGADIEPACEAYCEVLEACFPEEPPPADCVDFCLEDAVEVETEECTIAIAALYQCYGSLTCEELEGDGGQCVELEAAVDEACAGDDCFVGVGGGEGECGWSYDCPDVVLEMDCDTETCTCLEDRVEVGSCDAMGICEDIGGLGDYVEVCCGFASLDPME